MTVEGLNLDSTLMRCVIEGTKEGLSMTGIVPDAVGASRFHTATQDLSIIVGLHGKSNGNMTINVSKRTACFLASRFVGEERNDLDEDAIDAVCELGNMVAGRFKELLLNTPWKFDTISLPALIFGANYNLYHVKNIITVSVTFEIKEVSVVHIADKFFSTTISLLSQA